MKKYLLFFGTTFVFLVSFLFYGNANAISGACSYHSGVNCSIGADFDGSVICNDLWGDSSVKYDDADECKTQKTCVPPVASGCTNESQYATLQTELIRGGTMQYAPEISSGFLAACRKEIITYQSSQVSYQSCLSTNANHYSVTLPTLIQPFISDSDTCKIQFGKFSVPSDTNDGYCKCVTEYKFGKNDQCVSNETYCTETLGTQAWFNSSTKKCTVCASDEIRNENICISQVQNCKNIYGANSFYDDATKSCACELSYKLFSGQCVAKKVQQISRQAKQRAESIFPTCMSDSLTTKDTSECVDYRLHRDDYVWEVYNSESETVKTESKTAVEPILILPVKQEEKETVKEDKSKKIITKPPSIQNPPTKTTMAASSSINSSVEHKPNKQVGFFAKIKNMLLSIWK